MSSRAHGKPYWLYCNSLYPIGKPVWECFAQNIVGAIDIGIELAPALFLVQASLDAPA